MIACPNINQEDYKYAVEKLGKYSALYLYDLLGQEIPTKDQVDNYLKSTNQKISSNELSNKLLSFLNKLNVTVDFRDDLKELSGYDAQSLTDLLYKTILIKNNYKEEGLLKESAYVAYSFLGKKNKIRTDLIHSIENIDNYNSIFNDYRKKSPQLSDGKIKELIVIDFIADAIKNNFNVPKDSYQNRKADYWSIKADSKLERQIKYYLLKIKAFLDNLFKDTKLSKEELNLLVDDIANDILNNNFSKFGTNLSEEQQLTNYSDTLSKNETANDIISSFQNIGLLLTGSLSLRRQGTLYRSIDEDLHDLDFTVDLDSQGSYINDLIQKELESFPSATEAGSDFIIKNILSRKEVYSKHPILNKIKELYPSFKVTTSFKGIKPGEVTISGTIGNYSIDLFFVQKNDLDSQEKGFQDWQPIFKAKLMMGRAKDIRDFANYIPYNMIMQNVAQESGLRHFTFAPIKNNLTIEKLSRNIEVFNKKEPETKSEFLKRMYSRVENGKYKQKDGTLVDLTDSYNPETWWVEKIEKLVTFKNGRQSTLFTFDKVIKELQRLVKLYGPEDYTFRYEQVVFPVSQTQKSLNSNFAPNNRKIWKITVTKALESNKDELSFSEQDIQEAVHNEERKVEDVFENISDKNTLEIFDYLESVDFPEEQKKLLSIIHSKLFYNPTLKIVVIDNEDTRYGFFDPETNTIYLNRFVHVNNNGNSLQEVGATIVHELLHAFTLKALHDDYTEEEKEFKTTIERLYAIAKKQSKYTNRKAYKNIDEFLAYMLTDSTIMKEAMTMKLNLWQRFLRALHKFFTGSSVYDATFEAVITYLGKAEMFKPTGKSYWTLNRDISEDVYLNKENVTHQDIWAKLDKFSQMFDFDPTTHTYTLIKDAEGNDLKDEDKVVFSSVTEMMKRTKFYAGDRINPDPDKADIIARSKARATGIGHVIHALSEADIKKIAADLSMANGMKYIPDVVTQIENILKPFKKKGITILSEVLVSDLDLKLAGFIDLLVIDSNNNFHIYDFKTKEKGFKDYLVEKSYGGAQTMSDKDRHSIQISIYRDLLEKMTGIKVNTLNIITLKPQVEDNVIVNVELDKTHSKNGIITVPYNKNTKLLYAFIKSNTKTNEENNSYLSDPVHDQIDVEEQKQKDAEFRASLKSLYDSSKQLSEREKMVIKSLEALSVKRQIAFRSSRAQDIESIDKAISDITKEKDVEKQLKIIVDFAHKTAKRIFNEYEKYQKKNEKIPLNILSAWRDSILAFDAILNEEDGLRSVITLEIGLKNGGPDYINALDETIKLGGLIKSLYSRLGTEQLVDYLSPFFHMAYAEMRILKIKEYRRKKIKGEIPKGVTEKDYVEKSIDENEETLQERTRTILRAEIKKASKDIGTLARWIDNLLDSKDPITAAMIKGFIYEDEKARLESLEKRTELVSLLRRVEDWYRSNGGIPKSIESFYDFMLEKINGEYSGYYIMSYYSSMMKEYKNIIEVARGIENIDNRKAYIRAWLDGDEDMPGNWVLNKDAFQDEYWKFINEQKDNGYINDEEYNNLKQNQMFKNKSTVWQMVENNALRFETGELLSKWLGNNIQAFRTPSSKWSNPQFQALKKILDNPNDPRGDLYNYIVRMRMEADSYIPFGYRLNNRLPGVIKQDHERIDSGQSIGEVIRGALSKRFTFKIDDTTRVHEELLDEAGNPKYLLPTHFTGRVTKEVKEITEEGEERVYRKFDPKEQSFDLAGIYFKYWSMANDYYHKSQVLPEMELAKFIINNRPTVKRDSMGRAVLRKIYRRTNAGDESEEEKAIREQTVNTSNLADQVNDWFEACVYGRKEKDAGLLFGKIDVTKLFDFINSYTSLNLLGVNFVAGTANVLLGETLERIESFAMEYMTPKDFLYADKFHLKTLGGITGDIGSRAPKSLGSNLIEFFGILDDYGNTNMDVRTKFGQLVTSNTVYFTLHSGEHYMQSRFLFGLLANKEMKDLDGKVIGRLLDQYEMKDGKLQLKQKSTMSSGDYERFLRLNKWTEEDQLAFKVKVRGILSRLHGEYSSLGRVAIQRMALGRMAYLFRHFIVPGFRRRWGHSMWETRTIIDPITGKKSKEKFLRADAYMERLEQFVEGNYITTGNYIGNTIGTIFSKDEEHPEYAFLQRLMSNLQSFKMSIFKEEWASLTDHEKANIQRTLYEVGFLIIAVIMANLAMKFKIGSDDDDDEFESRFWAFTAYQAYRLQNELLFFSPKLDSAMSILRSPAASMSVIENIIDLSGQIFHPMDRDERGKWKGRLTIIKTLNKMVPVERQFYRLGEMEQVLPWMYKTSLTGTPKSIDDRHNPTETTN